MGIILRIRQLLRLDSKTIEIDNNVIDATGLMIHELNYFMQPPGYGCFGYLPHAVPGGELQLAMNVEGPQDLQF